MSGHLGDGLQRNVRCSSRRSLCAGGRRSLRVRLWPVLQILRFEAMFHQLAVALLVADHDRPRVYFDDLPIDAKILDKHVIAVP